MKGGTLVTNFRGGSRIYEMGVHMYKGLGWVGGGVALPIYFNFLKFPIKMK